MSSAAADSLIDMVDHEELLYLFRDYIAESIEAPTASRPARPRGFDAWYETDFLSNLDDLTAVITLALNWERAGGGFLCGGDSHEFRVRVPATMLSQTGGTIDDAGLRRIGRKFADKMNRRLPSVAYHGKCIYHWTWD
jgi:hypothetical protein